MTTITIAGKKIIKSKITIFEINKQNREKFNKTSIKIYVEGGQCISQEYYLDFKVKTEEELNELKKWANLYHSTDKEESDTAIKELKKLK